MKLISGPFSYERNLGQVRMFLLDTYKKNGMLHYLIPTKIENQKFGPCGTDYSPKDDDVIKIWRISKNPDSEIIAVSHRGSAANYHIEIHPDYKHMESELFKEIENLEIIMAGEENSRMYMYTVSSDSKRPEVLSEMGYEDYGLHEYNYEFSQDASIPDNPLPEGYTIRSLRTEQDYLKFIEVIGSVYDHCRQHMTLEKMKFMTQAEYYHEDLTLATVDDLGRFVGFCMYRLDPLTKIAEIELLDVHPDFRNLGLEEAMASEGLQRVMKYQPILICAVEIDVSESLNEKLKAAGFIQSVTMNMW
ncbi:MAG: hypothetical protein E4H14_07680, partial [Candidatus Thorarchaeota archaeon]